jgi:hypothetical protein
MCFPSKWLKRNFSEEETPAPSGSEPTNTAENPAGEPAAAPANGATGTTIAKEDPNAPKIAIVIYTMFGHIATREPKRDISPDLWIDGLIS